MGVGSEPSDTGVQEGPSEPSSEHLVEFPSSSSQQPIEAPASEEFLLMVMNLAQMVVCHRHHSKWCNFRRRGLANH